MRTVALTALLVAFSCAASAQKFTLLPQVGFENSQSVISWNDLSTFSPAGVKFSPQASIRLNYSSKQGHGFFLGAATSRAVTAFNFSSLENGMNDFSTTTGNMQIRLEGGYQFNTKPIFFSNNKAKQTAAKKATAATKKTTTTTSTYSRSGCGKSYTYSRCGSEKKKEVKEQKPAAAPKAKGSWVRFQPSIGMGLIPAVQTDVITKTQGTQTSYEYRAGNMSTALVTGAGFEFGRNNTRLFTLSVNYFNGMSNMGKRTITQVEGPKTTTTTLQSDVSGWNLRIGIPFNLGKSNTAKNKNDKVQKVENRCGQYKTIYRCRRAI